MKKHEYNGDVNMKLTPCRSWHADVWLPADARITEIHLRVYSFGFPDFIYGLTWGLLKSAGRRLQIPIDAARQEQSNAEEAVRLAIDLTFYSDSDD
jgi:hypothetical protein